MLNIDRFNIYKMRMTDCIFSHLKISGSRDAMSSENRYGGLLTKVVTGLMSLSRVSASDKKQNKTKESFYQQRDQLCYLEKNMQNFH